MEYFVDKESIVRKIWGNSDTVLLIFAGSAAEFALHKSVDWLYFTGKLPADPMGRLFSTVNYAKAIIFSKKQAALHAIDSMTTIHSKVEADRGAQIPDWAYSDVLFMLIDYSIRSYELLHRKLTETEKKEIFEVFHRVGTRMGLQSLPDNYEEWVVTRVSNLMVNLEYSSYTSDLFLQYRKNLGDVRYFLLKELWRILLAPEVKKKLDFKRPSLMYPLVAGYKLSRLLGLDPLVKALLLPSEYKKEIRGLEVVMG